MYDQLIKTLQPLVDRVRTDATATMEAGGVRWTDHPLTPEALRKHLNGGPARGVAPIKPGESTTMVALLDLDSHKGEATWDEMAGAAQRLTDAMLARGLVPSPWRSRGGNGIHLILMWDEPQDAYSVRCALVDVLAECGMTNGTGGVHAGQVEIFPKQDRVPEGKWGNQFFLPLAGKSEPLIPALGWEGGGKESAIGMVWPVSSPVPVRVKPDRSSTPAVYDSLERPILDRMLMTLPNSGGNEFDDRDLWFTTLCAYKDGGGDKEFAREWSAQHPTHSDDHFESTWNSITIGAEGGARVDFLCNLAERYGFTELIESTFEVQVVDQGEPEAQPLPVFKRDKNGLIEATATNAQLALSRSDFCGFRLGFDEFMHRRVICEHGGSEWRPFKDSDYFELRVALEQKGFKNPGQDLVREAVRNVAEHNCFDSAINWGNGLVWDGVPRVATFFERYLGVKPSPYVRAVAYYMWTALAGRCMDPGCKVDMVPVFIGDQGSGKSTLVETLAPTEEAFIEINLGNRNDEQVSRSLRGKLVGEIGELRGLLSRESEDIKAWITKRNEEIRALYAEFHAIYHRRLVMIGTGNKDEFLNDETGERRWLPLKVGVTDIDALKADRDQLWAEGIAIWRKQGVRWKDAMDLAKAEHAAFKVSDAWADVVEAWIKHGTFGEPDTVLEVTAHEVLVSAIQMQNASIKKADEMRAAKVLASLGFTKVERWEDGRARKKWQRARNCA